MDDAVCGWLVPVSLPVMVWVMKNSKAKLGARLVHIALAEHAHDDGTKAFPCNATLRERTALSERAVRDCLRKLEADGAIIRTGTVKSGTPVYTVVMDEAANPAPAKSAPGSSKRRGGQNGVAGGQISLEGGQTLPPIRQDPSEGPVKDPSDVVGSVRAAWLEAPGMVLHRDAYFDKALGDLIKSRVKKYGLDDVISAITSYAFVVGSSEHYWKHRWTLGDFLKRGLDKFVPEAQPEQVFKQEARTRGERKAQRLAQYHDVIAEARAREQAVPQSS